jgi:hypothetical protein
VLPEKGASIDLQDKSKDKNDSKALILASMFGQMMVVEVLLELVPFTQDSQDCGSSLEMEAPDVSHQEALSLPYQVRPLRPRALLLFRG